MARAYMTESAKTSGESRGFLSRSRQDGGSGSRGLVDWARWGRWGGGGAWRRGWVLALLAVLLGAALFWHSEIPNAIGNLGSLWETFLPWGGVLVPVLALMAVLRRSALALVALLLPAMVWLHLFAGQFTSKSGTGGDLTVVTHNVNAGNPDPRRTARELAGSGADIVALEEVAGGQAKLYDKGLAGAYRYHKRVGTVGVWSKYPMRDTETVDIKMGWPRAMRTTVDTPHGGVAVYAAHLPSVRLQFASGFTAGQRDDSAAALGSAIADDPVDKAVLLGDLNGTMNDRALAPVTSQMRSTQGAAGDGPGFSWPASFPTTRIDQIMVKGLEPVSSWSLPATGSDHLPVAASVNF
ncbi:vancomycin resistance protein VanJ [Streptomyces sp. WMMB 714]|uniref:endonuclease/exonuclease/phosphatase family protein n=1 Tax=Streptomyces sp. WMMB 714 TaxID=1286822 RepID=UPI0005F7FAE1|nr:endonuclease/exonuclease/phosphatase family protein [Streptomyces sp. WMMB 714]SCK17102.1 vancomycin resistance protein VanJ [Streptomyces sp. WMMB 714]